VTDDFQRDEHVVPGPNAPEPIEGGPDRLLDPVAHEHFESDMQMEEPEVRVAPDSGAIHWHEQPADGLAEDGASSGRSTSA
jgi:hypothetical protein